MLILMQLVKENFDAAFLKVSSLEKMDMFGCGLLKFHDFKTLFGIIDHQASPEHGNIKKCCDD